MMAVCAIILLSSCSKTFLITSGNENLRSLTKITDAENSNGRQAFGGYEYDGILLSVKNGYYYNLYRKDNPLAPAMTQITTGNNYNTDPTICPAIDRIAFSKYTEGGQSRDIYMMPATKGASLIPVTESADRNEFSPSFSKDGQYIVYQKSLYELDVNGEIWLKNLKTGETMLLGVGCSPRISPDGTKIVFTKFINSYEGHIWVMDIDGSNAMQLTGSKKEFAIHPCWSPSGKQILFQNRITSQKSDFDLYVMNSDGTDLIQLTNNESEDGYPYWAPDNSIYFTSDRGGKQGVLQIWKFQYSE